MGEQGLGLGLLFVSYFLPFTFLVIFPYAHRQATGHRYSVAFLRDFLRNPQNMPLAAVALALGLLALGWQRPEWPFPVDGFIVLSVALYYFTLGVNFAPPAFFSARRENGSWLPSSLSWSRRRSC
jgi:hypothetical protein